MTEEIIIDGVNVSGCEFYIADDKYSCDLSFTNQEELCKCDDVQDCTYKQLKRLEQENKELKERFEKRGELMCNCAKQRENYRSALEEIREDMEQDTTCESRECGCDDYAECLNCIKETILNKINEVLK